MASKNFVNGQLCVARVNSQPFLQCLEKREDLGGGQLEAGLLSAEDVGGLAGLGPGCVVVVVIRDITGVQRLWSSNTCVSARHVAAWVYLNTTDRTMS